MRVLVTRATADAARTCQLLRAAGHEVVVSPVIEIVALTAAWPHGVVDAVVATSAHAFIGAATLGGPSIEARRLLPLFLVGDRTAARARDAGFLGAATVTANAAALALAFGTLAHRPRHLLYLAGYERKPDIEASLSDAAQTLEILEVYDAQAAPGLSAEADTVIRAQALDAVLHYSRRSAELFIALAAAQALDVSAARHVCLSDDVAAPLREHRLLRIAVADAPNEPALLARLELS